MHLNSSGGECVMNEKAVLLQKQDYNILTASGFTAVQQLPEPNYRRFYYNNKKPNIISNSFNIYDSFVGVGDVFSKHSSGSLSPSHLYSWVWSGSRFRLWCSAERCGRAAPSGDRGYSGTSPCGCT